MIFPMMLVLTVGYRTKLNVFFRWRQVGTFLRSDRFYDSTGKKSHNKEIQTVMYFLFDQEVHHFKQGSGLETGV